MKIVTLKQLLLMLVQMREANRDTTESCVTEQIDEAIQLVEALLEDKGTDENLKLQLLATLGRLFDSLPSVIALIELFR